MAQPNHDPTAGDVLGVYLRGQATAFLRALRVHEGGTANGSDATESSEAARGLRGAARRIAGSLSTFRVVTDSAWADSLRTELVWLSSTLADEHAYAARLSRLMEALQRLSGSPDVPSPRPAQPSGALTVGSARAGALLERQLTLARTRAHSATLQALGSSRFHAVADAVAVLASEVPLDRVAARGRIEEVLVPLASVTETRLDTAVSALPDADAATAYSAHEDSAWYEVRRLLRVHRYAREALGDDVTRLTAAGLTLDRHRDASEAATASATAARTPRIAPATAYALGVLHADQRHAALAARQTFHTLWHPVPATTPS
ncbi:CHAD domain-containing protein [Streptomyces sp. NPDC101733]|uniref:CHAD domain-containing protein n=1 Tax=unclassified Streptomyces TaxID=2593676 RepID=UPI003800F0AD